MPATSTLPLKLIKSVAVAGAILISPTVVVSVELSNERSSTINDPALMSVALIVPVTSNSYAGVPFIIPILGFAGSDETSK